MKIIIFCITLLLAWPVAAQIYNRDVNGFRVVEAGDTLAYGLLGGSLSPKCEFVDIDADGDKDLFIVQLDGRVTFMENRGTAQKYDFHFVTDDYDSLRVSNWARWVDIDADGDMDILASGQGSVIRRYENVGTPQTAHYLLAETALRDTSGQTILSEFSSVPDLADIDGDGDLDLFTGRSAGTLAFYENVGSASTVAYRFVTDSFEDILIISIGKPMAEAGHGASGIRFYDVDQDGDADLFWGDFFSSRMYFLRNDGTPFVPDFPNVTTTAFPGPGLHTAGFNMPVFSDIDADGDADLFINVLTSNQETGNFWFYRNNLIHPASSRISVQSLAEQFTLETTQFLDGLDAGRQSNPVLVDIDQDGDRDLFIGNYQGRIIFYRNISSSGSRIWERDTTLDLPVPDGMFLAAPAFADIDGDGDPDAVAGHFEGTLMVFENTGSAADPVLVYQNSNFGAIDIGSYSTPAFADLDHDGDLDLVIGEEEGRVNFCRNTGSRFQPVFAPPEELIPAGERQFSTPELVDVDGDGDYDLFIGARDGYTAYYENRGDSVNFHFVEIRSQYKQIKTTFFSVMRFADLDGDGDRDLVQGNMRGGMEYYEAKDQSPVILSISGITAEPDSLFHEYLTYEGSPKPVFSLQQAPAGMTIRPENGELRWIPAADQRGDFAVKINASSASGSMSKLFTVTVTGPEFIPDKIVLRQNYPNPFNGETTIIFDLPAANEIELSIYNTLGQKVRTLLSGRYDARRYRVSWDGLDERGRAVASGVYFYRLRWQGVSQTKRMIVVK